MASVAQERATEFLGTQCDKVLDGPLNEQGNLLLVLLDEHARHRTSEAGTEIARMLVDPSGFVIWASVEPGYSDEFDAIFDAYIRAVGIVHPTRYGDQ